MDVPIIFLNWFAFCSRVGHTADAVYSWSVGQGQRCAFSVIYNLYGCVVQNFLRFRRKSWICMTQVFLWFVAWNVASMCYFYMAVSFLTFLSRLLLLGCSIEHVEACEDIKPSRAINFECYWARHHNHLGNHHSRLINRRHLSHYQ